MNLKSIRWRLPASYAAIALLAAVVLGGVLVVTLRSYYGERERENMRMNAEAMSFAISKMVNARFPSKALQDQVKSLASLVQARIRLLGEDGEVLADSGTPDPLQALTFSARPPVQGEAEEKLLPGQMPPVNREKLILKASGGGFTPTVESGAVLIVNPEAQFASFFSVPITDTFVSAAGAGGAVTDTIQTWASTDPAGPIGLIAPIKSSLYGYTLGAAPNTTRRSDQEVSLPVIDKEGRVVANIVLSEGPSYGWEIIDSVMRSWAVAGAVAVLLAAGTGWLISRQVTAPLLALAGVTAEMAGGNLSARASADSPDEFGLLGRSFNEMAGRIEETVHTLRNFVADAAHELHTPLTALRTNLELVAPPGDKALAGAQAQVNRLENLVNSLLDLSRIEAGLNVEDGEPLSLPGLVRETVELYASRADQSGVSFELLLPEEEILIEGNRGYLRQALGNLLDNAVKFTPPGGSITAGAGEEGGWGHLWVEDTGIGIPPQDLPRLFNRFHRGRNAASYPGSGLGLAIVKAIAEEHAGEVWVQSAAGKTRFTIRLPIKAS